jgi:hypothetical protein
LQFAADHDQGKLLFHYTRGSTRWICGPDSPTTLPSSNPNVLDI